MSLSAWRMPYLAKGAIGRSVEGHRDVNISELGSAERQTAALAANGRATRGGG